MQFFSKWHFFLASAWVALMLAPQAVMARGPVPSCDIGDGQVVVVKQITPQFDLALEDGRVLRVAGLYPSFDRDNPVLAQMVEQLSLRAKDDVVLARELSPVPDRWGRITAQVAIVGASGEPEALGPIILAQGGAMAKPEADIAQCRQAYLDAEALARDKAAGLWGSGKFAVYPAAIPDTLQSQDGRFTIVEGEVTRYGEGESRVFLDFGKRRGQDFSVTVLKKSLKAFSRNGQDLNALVGKNIRVRGTLDNRFGPRMEISTLDAIEILN